MLLLSFFTVSVKETYKDRVKDKVKSKVKSKVKNRSNLCTPIRNKLMKLQNKDCTLYITTNQLNSSIMQTHNLS